MRNVICITNIKKEDNLLKKLLYEPLLHFLVLGALLFFFYSFSNNGEDTQNSIVISKERIEQLITEWGKESFSIPTAEEKKEIIDKEIYQRVLYREALKTGLDKNDNTIKGHLAQKMEAIVFDTQELAPPSDEVLKKYLQEHVDKYREEEKISFVQNMTGPETTLFEKAYTLTLFEASNIFGRSFSEGLFALKVDGKVHKLESDYGVHEVRITDKSKPKLKTFDTVKEKLKDDYLKLQREEKNEETYEVLKSQYNINIEEK
jgi:hypothetical protein